MSEQLSPFALTTLQRVKDLLFDPNQTILVTGCAIVQNSTTVSGGTIPTGRNVVAGQQISGLGIPSGTTVASISGSTITLSQEATASNSGQTVTVVDQTPNYDDILTRMINYATNYINNECGRYSFVQQTYVNDTYSIDSPRQTSFCCAIRRYFRPPMASTSHRSNGARARRATRAGPISFPTSTSWWTPARTRYPAKSGIRRAEIRVYGVLPRMYSNMIRVSYTGGYPVNWANPEDHNTHWLPGDITSVCENLVVRRFKRRGLAGQSSQSLEGTTITGWRNVLDQEDLDVLGQYTQLNF